ncbi:serine/threonine-protein kinase [Spirillospora sp. CA-142024]|uniref:serine/threonine-protein kinase n=1 Tax=Spirillospora sp. CA-142024 TaxID=3240036 RepID=UPI003D8A0370
MPGRRLVERYRLVAPLGAGGMGTVWRAYDEVLGRDVAIKRIEVAEDAPPDERAMLRARAAREARAAALLDHPGVITVHDVVEPDGRPWIVMELVEGRSLDRVLDADGPLPPHRVAGLGARLLDALTAAHGRGLLHRDVKPANVLLAEDGRTILTDFGIATLDGDPALTRTGALAGSPGFIAPERLRDDPAGPASDLWSLGATLYTAVEGRAPFDRETPLAALGAVLTEAAPPAGRAGALAPVLARMLDKDPATRISAADALSALHRVAEGGASGLSAPTATSPGAGWVRRGRRAILLGGGVAVVVVAAAGVGLTRGHGDDPPAAHSTASAGPRPVASVDPCALITDEQARGLLDGAVRRRGVPDDGDCSWLAPKVPAVLTVLKPDAVAASFSAGRDQMAIKRNEVAGYLQSLKNFPPDSTWNWTYPGFPRTKVRVASTTDLADLAGVADEAMVHTERGSAPYDRVNVTLRQGNVVLTLQWSGPRTGPGSAAAGARRAALAVAATLAHLENRG